MFFNRNGSSTAIVLILGTAMLTGALAITSIVNQSVKTQKITRARNTLQIVRENIFSSLNNSAAWAETIFNVANNGITNCLRVDGLTCPNNLGVLTVVQGDGTVLIDNSANEGFDLQGNRCLNFNNVNGHETCIFKFQITALCDAPCGATKFPVGALVPSSPHIRLAATVSVRTKANEDYLQKNVNIQSSQYIFNFQRGQQTPGLEAFCQSIGGSYDPIANTCEAQGAVPATFDCTLLMANPQAYFIGYNSDGTPNCKIDDKTNSKCSAQTAVTGIMPDGRFRCSGY